MNPVQIFADILQEELYNMASDLADLDRDEWAAKNSLKQGVLFLKANDIFFNYTYMSQEELDNLLILLNKFRLMDKKYIYDQYLGLDSLATDESYIDSAAVVICEYRDMSALDMSPLQNKKVLP